MWSLTLNSQLQCFDIKKAPTRLYDSNGLEVWRVLGGME